MTGIYDKIDAVFVINLDHRTDRWISFQENWKDIIPAHKLIRSSGIVGTKLEGYHKKPWFRSRTGERARSWAGAAGCALSHKKVIREAQKLGMTRIMVMEDDAVPTAAMTELNYEGAIEQFLDETPEWGLLYLGLNKPPKIGVPVVCGEDGVEVWRISGALALHGYMVHRDAFTALLRNLPEEEIVWRWIAKYRAVDTWMREFFESKCRLPVFSIFPRLVIQGDFSSDICPHHTLPQQQDPIYNKPIKVCSVIYKLCSVIRRPLAYIKNHFNSFRTLRRAKKSGFPGSKT